MIDARQVISDIEQAIAAVQPAENLPSYSRDRLEIEMQIRGLREALRIIERHVHADAEKYHENRISRGDFG